ncbi:MAG: hypothetical protein M3T49_01670 [Candidatus Eremiobacteraeota bacterium]|nr:hypothetical protein [Candidatus Eremiobacteraeota bacterium]
MSPRLFDDMQSCLASLGTLNTAAQDADLNVSTISVSLRSGDFVTACKVLAGRCGGAIGPGRACRFELLRDDADGMLDEEALRAIAVDLHGHFAASIYVGRRSMPVSVWALTRPMPWGRHGLTVGQSAATIIFGSSQCHGVAVEVGAPTVVLKFRLAGMPEAGLLRACAAVSGPDSGFIDVAAYPGASAADGTPLVVLEFGELLRAPLHRSLAVLDIEVRRYGCVVGQAALLSHISLESLLTVLHAHTGLAALPSQVLETHLPALTEAGTNK